MMPQACLQLLDFAGLAPLHAVTDNIAPAPAKIWEALTGLFNDPVCVAVESQTTDVQLWAVGPLLLELELGNALFLPPL